MSGSLQVLKAVERCCEVETTGQFLYHATTGLIASPAVTLGLDKVLESGLRAAGAKPGRMIRNK